MITRYLKRPILISILQNNANVSANLFSKTKKSINKEPEQFSKTFDNKESNIRDKKNSPYQNRRSRDFCNNSSKKSQVCSSSSSNPMRELHPTTSFNLQIAELNQVADSILSRF